MRGYGQEEEDRFQLQKINVRKRVDMTGSFYYYKYKSDNSYKLTMN